MCIRDSWRRMVRQRALSSKLTNRQPSLAVERSVVATYPFLLILLASFLLACVPSAWAQPGEGATKHVEGVGLVRVLLHPDGSQSSYFVPITEDVFVRDEIAAEQSYRRGRIGDYLVWLREQPQLSTRLQLLHDIALATGLEAKMAIEQLLSGFRLEPEEEVRIAYVSCLGSLLIHGGLDDAIALHVIARFRGLLLGEDPSWNVRLQTAMVLTWFGSAEGLPIIRDALRRDYDLLPEILHCLPGVLRQMDVLRRMTGLQPMAVQEPVRLLRDIEWDSRDLALRLHATLTMYTMGYRTRSDVVDAARTVALHAEDSPQRIRAMELLVSMHRESPVDGLEGLLQELSSDGAGIVARAALRLLTELLVPGDPSCAMCPPLASHPSAQAQQPAIGSTPGASSSSSYNRQAAVDYAYTWWNGCNHTCGSYLSCTPWSFWGWENCCGYPSQGGDCANFVSQCVIAGGNDYLNNTSPNPPCRGYPCGKEEIGARNLANCLAQYHGWKRTCGYHQPPPSDITIGDVLVYHAQGCGLGAAHAVVVTYVSGSDVRVTCHSVNRKDEPYNYLSGTHPYYDWLQQPASAAVPVVHTFDASSVTSSTAYLWGGIVDDGGSAIVRRAFCWSLQTDASCNDNSTFNVTVDGSVFYYQATGLSPSTKYYFRAWAENSNGWGHGEVRSFTTQAAPNNPPNTPTLSSPSNGATNQSLTPTLQASAFSDPDGDSHANSQWQVDNNSTFSSPEWDSGESYTASTSAPVPAGWLAHNTTYYWRVRYKDSRGAWSSWSSSRYFTTICVIPDTPTGVSASDGAYSSWVRISWNSATAATSYEVHRARAACDNYIKLPESAASSYDDWDVAATQIYWYKVRACSDCGCSDLSSEVSGYSGSPGVGTAARFRVGPAGNVWTDGVVYGQCYYSGSADVAEWISISEAVEPGDVLEFDLEHPGVYRKARSRCSLFVAGVVSAHPGMTLGHTADVEGQALLALVGIVPVKVTNEGGSIQLGDLLVSSSTPGYAMRWAGPGPCLCYLVGKALEPMDNERGVILVLLTAH